MKAQARKILALIMAMVMCLSLAAPAFAAESAEPELETQAVETEAVELDVQEDNKEVPETFVANATDRTPKATADGYAYWLVEIQNGRPVAEEKRYPSDPNKYFAWSRTSDDYVDVAVEDLSPKTPHVGVAASKKKYTITEKKAFAWDKNKLQTASVTVEDKDTVVKLTDKVIADQFATLAEAASWKEKENDDDHVLARNGSFYQEETQDGGAWNYYFKLNPVKDTKGAVAENDQAFDTSASAKVVYVKATGSKKLTENKDIRDALFGAREVVNPDGTAAEAGKGFYKDYNDNDLSIDGKYTATLDKYTSGYEYAFAGVDADVLAISGTATDPVFNFTAAENNHKITTSFKVRMTTTVQVSGRQKTAVVTDKATVTDEINARIAGWSVTGISDTATNDYWTVTVTKNSNQGGIPAGTTFEDLKDNTVWFVSGVEGSDKVATAGTHTNLGLKDLDKPGSYNVLDKAGDVDSRRAIPVDANTKVYGSFAVKIADVPVEVGVKDKGQDNATLTRHVTTNGGVVGKDKSGKNTYYVFPTMTALKNALKNLDCSKDRSITVYKLVVNPIVNGKSNDGAFEDADDRWGAVGGWTEWFDKTDGSKNCIVDTATVALALDSNAHVKVTEYTLTAPTCKKEGSKGTKVYCRRCGKEFAAADSEKIDRVLVPVAVNPAAGSNGVYTLAQAKAERKEEHYLADYTIEEVKPTKTTEGKIVVHKFCNLGEEHEEEAETTIIPTTKLQYGDKWDQRDWGTQNTQYARDPSRLFGYSPMIYDSDKDLGVAMIGDDYYRFEFPTDLYYGDPLEKQTDGTYFAIGLSKINGSYGSYGNYGYKAATDKATYIATATVSNINVSAFECTDGSALVTLDVYKLLYDSNAYKSDDFNTPAKVAKLVEAKKIEKVSTHPKDITIPATKNHEDGDQNGLCDICGIKLRDVDPEPQPAVVKKAQPMILSVATKTLKVKNLKKKAATVKTQAYNAEGKVSYKLGSSSKKAKVTISKSGDTYKVKVPKGTKKGVYKVKFTAKGNKNFKAGSEYLVITVK